MIRCHVRDAILAAIDALGRDGWKEGGQRLPSPVAAQK